MSFFYICSDCGRGFTTEDLTKVGVWNKMFKPSWQGDVPQAGMYAKDPTFRCPYCLSPHQTVGTEQQRSAYLKEKRTYPARDPRWPAVQTAQKYEDCEINLDIASRTITGLSGDAEQRLHKLLESIGWDTSDVSLKAMTKEFTRGVICFRPTENTWYVYRRQQIFCAVRRGENADEYLFGNDGENFVPGAEADKKLLKKVNEAIADYSLMIRAES